MFHTPDASDIEMEELVEADREKSMAQAKRKSTTPRKAKPKAAKVKVIVNDTAAEGGDVDMGAPSYSVFLAFATVAVMMCSGTYLYGRKTETTPHCSDDEDIFGSDDDAAQPQAEPTTESRNLPFHVFNREGEIDAAMLDNPGRYVKVPQPSCKMNGEKGKLFALRVPRLLCEQQFKVAQHPWDKSAQETCALYVMQLVVGW